MEELAARTAGGRAAGSKGRWHGAKRRLVRLYSRRYRFTYRRTIGRLPSRIELPNLLNARGLLDCAVEVGVNTGAFSDLLLKRWRGRKLISIDPWLAADPDDYVDISNVSQDQFDTYYQFTRDRLSRYGERSDIWRTTSIDGAKRVADRSLDFIYIDARHDYDSVMEDLAAWAPKLKPGGIVAGHDYMDGDFPEGRFGVKSAVDEFFGARGIPVSVTGTAVELFPSWVIEVPPEGIEATRS